MAGAFLSLVLDLCGPTLTLNHGVGSTAKHPKTMGPPAPDTFTSGLAEAALVLEMGISALSRRAPAASPEPLWAEGLPGLRNVQNAALVITEEVQGRGRAGCERHADEGRSRDAARGSQCQQQAGGSRGWTDTGPRALQAGPPPPCSGFAACGVAGMPPSISPATSGSN